MATGAKGLTSSIDASTDLPMRVDYAHHEIHAGSTFVAWASTTDLDTNPIRIKFEVAAQTKRAHLFIAFDVVGQSVFQVTDSPTGGATGGSSFTPINRRRDSSKTSVVTITQGVSAPTGGTTMIGPLNFGDRANTIGGSRDSNEWILGDTDSSKTYVFELTSSTNSVVATIFLSWYEHADKNPV